MLSDDDGELMQLVGLRRPRRLRKDAEDAGLPWWIRIFAGVVIVANAVVMGVCIDVPDNDRKTSSVCAQSENVFTALFLLELLVKVYYMRRTYFVSFWNWMDMVLTMFAVLDTWILQPILGGKSGLNSMTVLRLLRLVKVLRLFKLLKQRKELLILIEGLGAAFSSMVWVALLMGIVIYGASLASLSIFQGAETDDAVNDVMGFSSLPSAMFTLFTVGIVAEWTAIVVPVTRAYWFAAPFFMAFVMLVNFAVLNLLVGVITERTQQVKEDYDAQRAHQADLRRMGHIEQLAQVIFEDRDTVTKKDLDRIMKNHQAGEEICMLLKGVNLPLGYGVADLHEMMDKDADGVVSTDEFTEGMAQLIFSGEFQHICVIQAQMAKVRLQMRALPDKLRAVVRSEIESLRTSLRAEVAGRMLPVGNEAREELLGGIQMDFDLPRTDVHVDRLGTLLSMCKEGSEARETWRSHTEGDVAGLSPRLRPLGQMHADEDLAARVAATRAALMAAASHGSASGEARSPRPPSPEPAGLAGAPAQAPQPPLGLPVWAQAPPDPHLPRQWRAAGEGGGTGAAGSAGAAPSAPAAAKSPGVSRQASGATEADLEALMVAVEDLWASGSGTEAASRGRTPPAFAV